MRRPRHGRRLAGRGDAAAWVCDLGDAVPSLHRQCLTTSVQRSLLHVQLQAGVLFSLGLEWVTHNGPGPRVWEKQESNGHRVEVSPLKRLLLRVVPELKPELDHVVNAFDPWARDRGEYYSLEWRARPGAESDPSFKE